MTRRADSIDRPAPCGAIRQRKQCASGNTHVNRPNLHRACLLRYPFPALRRRTGRIPRAERSVASDGKQGKHRVSTCACVRHVAQPARADGARGAAEYRANRTFAPSRCGIAGSSRPPGARTQDEGVRRSPTIPATTTNPGKRGSIRSRPAGGPFRTATAARYRRSRCGTASRARSRWRRPGRTAGPWAVAPTGKGTAWFPLNPSSLTQRVTSAATYPGFAMASSLSGVFADEPHDFVVRGHGAARRPDSSIVAMTPQAAPVRPPTPDALDRLPQHGVEVRSSRRCVGWLRPGRSRCRAWFRLSAPLRRVGPLSPCPRIAPTAGGSFEPSIMMETD